MSKKLPPDIQALLDKLEPQMRDAFLEAVKALRSSVSLKAVVEHLEAGRIEQAVTSLGLDEAFFDSFVRVLGEAYLLGGRAALSKVKSLRDPLSGSKLVLVFNSRAPRAEQWLKAESSRLIGEITRDTRDLAREALRKGLETGRNPRSVAMDLVGRMNAATRTREGGLLGLTSQQSQFVENARSELINSHSGYFDRTLRDKRYDGLVKKAFRSGKPLSASEVDMVTGRYSDRLLKYRADVIARTEMLNALRVSRHESYVQLIESGKVEDGQIERVWSSTGDDRTRDSHEEMDGQIVRGISAPFVTPRGERLLFPGDTSLGASPSETIQCRCFETVRVRYL